MPVTRLPDAVPERLAERDGVRRYATTEWNVTWNYDWKKVEQGFVITNVTVNLAIVYRLPRRVATPGKRDAIATPAQVERLATLLRQAGADVTLEWHEGGHELNAPLARSAKAWFAARFG